MSGEPMPPRRFPRVPMDRRVAAFAIDFSAASLLSVLLGGSLYPVIFLVTWLGLRVILVVKNKGQSLGRWALDMKVADPRFKSIPGVAALAKREALTGLGSLLVLIGLVNLSPTNGWILVAPIPLLVDCGFAFVDNDFRQAFHDRIASTVVIQTRRGYSLDIKLKKIVAAASRRVK